MANQNYSTDFQYSNDAEPHIARTKEILKKYPEIKKLMGRNQNSFWFIVSIVGTQILLSFLLRNQPWWLVLICAWVIGAFANHALFVLIHECTHNLVFRSRLANMWAGILCDLPNGFPSSAGFRKYHLKHHAFQGNYEIDADIPSRWEAKLIGKSFIGKSIWLLLFPIFQGLRPPRLKEIQFSNKWIWINLVVVVAFDVAVAIFWGPMALLYLVSSFFFSVGLHPLGGRWIQEHYLIAPPQETYSYYGPLNKLSFNVGFHNEHHDFSYVPWNNLPKIRAIAPEYYDTLHYHKSWSALVWQFLTDGDISLFSRTLRENRGGLQVTASAENDFFSGMKKKEQLTSEPAG